MKTALITGITGQDGSYLAEYLLDLDYKVYGIIRRKSVVETQTTRIDHLLDNPNLITEYGDMTDSHSLIEMVSKIKPEKIFNLAAQSHVGVSSRIPESTANTNGLGVLRLLEAVKTHSPESKVYQASSSELFGNQVDEFGFQRETTPMFPVSPYGCSKLYAFHIMRHYREAYRIFASNGILFNHESPRRGGNFVTQKIVRAAIAISKGEQDILELGNLDACRDWGHSWDYVRAMNMILDYPETLDICISTGETHSVREFCKIAFSYLGLDYKEYIQVNPKFFRPNELNRLRGDCSRAKKLLGWVPKFTFQTLIEDMIEKQL